jgi:PAS domain-containing protein
MCHPSNDLTNHLCINSLSSSMDTIEHHVNLLRELNHPIPHQVWQLLLEQRAIEEKKMAKRLVNRKSASTSRARKKKLVEEMAQNNARLRRQAIILSLLPDLVMAITTDGEITFCSGQVEVCISCFSLFVFRSFLHLGFGSLSSLL